MSALVLPQEGGAISLSPLGPCYEGLRLVTEEGAWEPWGLYNLEGVKVTAKAAIAHIHDIRDAILHFYSELQKKDPKLARLELVHTLFQQPYCRIRDFEKAGIAKRQAASEYL